MLYFLTFALLFAEDAPRLPDAKAVDSKSAVAEKQQAGGSKTKSMESDAPAGDKQADDASEESADGDEAPSGMSFWERLDEILSSGAIGLLREGGWFMWPILIMGVIAAGVIIERYRCLNMLSTDTSDVRSQVRDLLQADRVEEALELCDSEQGPVPAVLSAGVRKFLVLRRLNYDAGRIEEQVVKAMDDYGIHIVAALERHLPVLATVSSVAPMLGFLGTVSGMINSFKEIVAKMGETNIVESAAGGISEALLTTCFGLIIGIPAFIAFNYFTSVINRFVLDVEESATELIEVVTLQLALRQQGE